MHTCLPAFNLINNNVTSTIIIIMTIVLHDYAVNNIQARVLS